MFYIESAMRISYEVGLQEGFGPGFEQGERRIVLRLLSRRIGEIDAKTQKRIERLSLRQLEELSEALLGFTQAPDLKRWLSIHAKRRAKRKA